MDVLKVIFICLEVLLLFNLLIFVHELGHFLAARWRGLKVERFAIWFGKPIWKTKINGVEYCLGSIPAGGYVSLPQMAPMEIIEGKSDEEKKEPLPPISALDKIIVAFAGPLFSFLLALVFAVVVMFVGRPESESEKTTILGYVEKGGPADKAGLKAGDRILEVDDRPVVKYGGMGESIQWHVISSEGETIPVKYVRSNEGGTLVTNTVQVTPVKDPTTAWKRKSLRQIKVDAAQTPIIGDIVPGSPAEKVGLRKHDQIMTVDNQKLWHFAGVSEYLREHPGRAVTLSGLRDGKPFETTVTPVVPLNDTNGIPRVGIEWLPGGRMALSYPGAIEQVRASVNAMVSTFAALFSRKSDVKPQHLGGAVKILSVYYLLFESEQGWRLALWFSVLMNVNLAILNMLPFPVLDGGHITLALVEAVRRKPVNARILNYLQTACAVALIAFMVYIAFFDVQELPWGRKDRIEIQFPKE